jgi:integrase
MAGWFAGEVSKINKQVVVGKRRMTGGESDEYYARIWLRNLKKYKYVNLETLSLTGATESAIKKQALFEVREEEGLAVFRTSISSKLDDFESEYLQRSVSAQRKVLVKNQLQRFGEYFFGRTVNSISATEYKDYIKWRKQNNRRGKQYSISNSVLHSEVILMNSFVGHLANSGAIGERLFRSLKASGWSNFIGKKETRGAFTVAQYKTLRDYTANWHTEEKLDGRARYTRKVVHWLIRIAGHTGLRTIELKNLRWRDIVKHEKGCVLSVKGKSYAKRERFRRILSDSGTHQYLYEVKILSQELANETRRELTDNDFVFVKHSGKQADDLWAQNISIALSRLDMKRDEEGRRISLYSLRHYFATRQIEAGVSIYDLAEYMGTSVSMIEQYYGKGTHEKLGMRVMGDLIEEELGERVVAVNRVADGE